MNTRNKICLTAQAKGRVDFTGGFTDVVPLRDRFPAKHVNLSINRSVIVSAEPWAGDINLPGEAGGIGDSLKRAPGLESLQAHYLDACWRLLLLRRVSNFQLRGDLPMSVGLGSSAALAVALVRLQLLDAGDDLAPEAVAERAYEIECAAGHLCGKQDQYASACENLNLFTFHGASAVREEIRLTAKTTRLLNCQLSVLCFPGKRNSASVLQTMLSQYALNAKHVEPILVHLNRLADGLRNSLAGGNLDDLGPMLHEVQRRQRELVSCCYTDAHFFVLTALRNEGILGAKAVGGGGHAGTLLVFGDVARVRFALHKCGAAGVHVIDELL
jgi:galactokinase/mevalonate kinase-like predicted kinase